LNNRIGLKVVAKRKISAPARNRTLVFIQARSQSLHSLTCLGSSSWIFVVHRNFGAPYVITEERLYINWLAFMCETYKLRQWILSVLTRGEAST
jgi:hypothetical protein